MHGRDTGVPAAGAVEVEFGRVLGAVEGAEAEVGDAAGFEGAAGLERLEL